MNMMAPSPAVPNLLDGGGLLNPAPSGMQAPIQMNHEPIAPQNQNQNHSGLFIELLLFEYFFHEKKKTTTKTETK